MRVIQIQRKRYRSPDVIRRLQFFANGAELLAWVGDDRPTRDGRVGHTELLLVYAFETDSAQLLDAGAWSGVAAYSYSGPDPLVSSNRALLVFEHEDGAGGNDVFVENIEGKGKMPPLLQGCTHGFGGMAFAPGATILIAVRNIYEGVSGQGGHWAPDVVSFDAASIGKSSARYEEKRNPLTHATYRMHLWDVVMNLPHRKAHTIALSADGNLLAVGGIGADLHVADLKRKKVLASFPWEGRFLRDGHPVRVGFDPAAQWVVMLANRRLFARPLRDGKPWQTKATLGYVHDFAFHPSGNTLCAVFRDGQARYLDPLTGKVRQAFKWAKKPAPLYSVAFAPDGLTCAAGGENGKVILWDVDA